MPPAKLLKENRSYYSKDFPLTWMKKSIQVKGQGNFTIQAVNKRLDFMSEKEVGEKVKALEDQIDLIRKSQTLAQNRLQILATKASLLSANKDLGGSQNGPTMAELRTALDFFRCRAHQNHYRRAENQN
ncbi:DUF4140 domain-containing protein [Algoriphagus boritolerans]|uniref:DUF4140 domain-containing protein n=1 Tax=Algoriphagus boritolerans TaxID=308111 RepID=UPI002FCE2042